MPLLHSASPQAFNRNVKTLMGDIGKSPHVQSRAQALAIAFATKRRAGRAAGGVVPGYEAGGIVEPQQTPSAMGVAPAMMPPPMGAPGMAAPAPAMNSAPGLPPSMPNQPPPGQGLVPPTSPQWAQGVAQNAAPPAIAQNAAPTPPGPVNPMARPLMAAGGGLARAQGGMNMAKAPNLNASWQTRAEDRRLHVGPILSAVMGRTDNHRAQVPSGSYVLPAAHIASMGHGNSIAGLSLAQSMFGGPYGMAAPRMARGSTMPRLRRFADGGTPQESYGQPVDVDLSGGEYVIPPEAIIARYGNLKDGHRILDAWVMDARKREIATQKKLPPPAQS